MLENWRNLLFMALLKIHLWKKWHTWPPMPSLKRPNNVYIKKRSIKFFCCAASQSRTKITYINNGNKNSCKVWGIGEILSSQWPRRTAEEKFYDSKYGCSNDGDMSLASPTHDIFLNVIGLKKICLITSFTATELTSLSSATAAELQKNGIHVKGGGVNFQRFICFLFTLNVLKGGNAWDFHHISSRSKQWRLRGRLAICWKFWIHSVPYICGKRRETVEDGRICGQKTCFQHYKFARYAKNVMFQKDSRSADTARDGKLFCSDEHHFYGWKNGVPALPDLLAAHLSNFGPDLSTDIKIEF